MIQLFLNQQEQLEAIDQKLQLVLEQITAANHQRFSRSSEKVDIDKQIAFCELDGKLVFFNEAEAVADLELKQRKILQKTDLKNAKANMRKN